jgi:hypothetical protein
MPPAAAALRGGVVGSSPHGELPTRLVSQRGSQPRRDAAPGGTGAGAASRRVATRRAGRWRSWRDRSTW